MAKAQGLNNRLKLSDLKNNAEYPMGTRLPDGRCLIHVKLTDFCVKSIESLINSEKGAFFSLWFEESGGTMAIPLANGGSRRFKFKTALRQEAEGKGSLECVHQAIESSRPQLMCIGPIDHRLTVQGTDEVYDRTKKLMKEAEEKKKEARAQEIKLPGKARPKSKLFPPPSSSPPVRKPPGRPPQHKPVSSSLGPKTGGPKPPSAATRSPRTLRERIIHLLALKPQRRNDVVTRLKKETKRSESAMSNLDSILSEVSEVRQGYYYLKQQYFAELQVEEWPFYSDTERQLVRRSISACAKEGTALSAPSGELQPLKRPLSSSAAKYTDPPPPKKPKISHSTPTSSPAPPSHSYQPPPQESTLPPPHSTSHHKPPNSLHTSMPSTHKLVTPSTTNAGHKTATVPSFPTSTSSQQTSSSRTSAVAQNSQSQPLTLQQIEPPHLYSSFVHASTGLAVGTSSSTGLTTVTSTSTAGGMRVATLPLTMGTRDGKNLKISLEEATAEPSQEDLPEAKKIKKNKKEKKKKKKDKHSTRLASGEGEREPTRLASGEGEGEPARLASGEGEREPTRLASGEGKREPTRLASGEGKREPTRLAGGEGEREPARLTGGEGEREPTRLASGEGKREPTRLPVQLVQSDGQFLPIVSEEQRTQYKQIFNEEYEVYVNLKERIECAAREFTPLTERWNSVSKNSPEGKELRKRIQEKYPEMQQYQEQKRRFEELHLKLSHIKQLVLNYDNRQAQPKQLC